MANSAPDFTGLDAAPSATATAPGPDFSGLEADPAPKQAYDATAHLNPDVAAKVLPIAAQTGETPAYVEKNLPTMQRAVKEAAKPFQDFFANLRDRAPRSFDVLSDPDTMAQTHDDLNNLPTIEQIARTAA